MTLRHLQIFKTVCDCQCITSAAEKRRSPARPASYQQEAGPA